MGDIGKYLNLIWKVPAAVIVGGIGYSVAKGIIASMLYANAHYMNARDITAIGTLIPLIIPIGCLVWAFWEFIAPKIPKQPPGGYLQ